jgi:hypothetical protein
MQTGNGGNGHNDDVLRELEAARAAFERGALVEAIGHLDLGKQLCGRLAVPALTPSDATAPDEALDITAASTITGYSVSRLRHIGHTLPGYRKWPDGKVTWSRRRLTTFAQGNA